MARSERFELPTLGIEIRCSIQLSYERINKFNDLTAVLNFSAQLLPLRSGAGRQLAEPNSHLARIFSRWLCATRFSDLDGTECRFGCWPRAAIWSRLNFGRGTFLVVKVLRYGLKARVPIH